MSMSMAPFKLLLFVLGCLFPCMISARDVVHRRINNDDNRILRHDSSCRGVAYASLGCFDLHPPFTNTRWLPQSPMFIGTQFLLFTRENRRQADHLSAHRSSSIQSSNFNSQNPTKILVHGFLQHSDVAFLRNMTKALLDEAAMNVIVVGWSGGAGFPYGQAVANTRLVGAEIAQLGRVLVSEAGMTLSQVHIIGHSLGAHVAGYAGARLPGLGRITGLDPAQPNYHGFDPEVRLDPTDASLVDIIHTDALPYGTVHGYGMIEPVGHIDFYPNGGHNQPGCQEDDSIFDVVEDAFSNGVHAAESGISCSHERSTALFIASINQASCSFQAFPCPSAESFFRGECTSCGNAPCPTMGLHAGAYLRARGVYYLNTTANAPYCGHHHVVTLILDSSMDYAIGSLQVKFAGLRGGTGWTEITSGELHAGSVFPKIVLSHGTIGDVVSVKVKFTKQSGFFSWSSDQVLLRQVKITSPIQGLPKFFCPANMVLTDGQPLTLTGGSYTDTDC